MLQKDKWKVINENTLDFLYEDFQNEQFEFLYIFLGIKSPSKTMLQLLRFSIENNLTIDEFLEKLNETIPN